MVIIHHNINGRTYTSVYAHLNSIAVSEGTTVTRNTVIGYSGGGRNTMSSSNLCGLSGGTGWDRCSCGDRLHLTLATGLYGVDYNFTQMNYKYSINPRLVINLPSGNGKFENRIEEYISWIDDATSKSELIDVLYDIKEDLTTPDEYDDEEEEGGRQLIK